MMDTPPFGKSLWLALLVLPWSETMLCAQTIQPGEVEVSANDLRLSFQAPAGTETSRFELQSNDDLQGAWSAETSAVFTEISPGAFRVTLGRPDGEMRNFYRVLLDGEVITVTFGATPVVREGVGNSQLGITLSSPFSGSIPYEISFADGTKQSGVATLENATTLSLPFAPDDDRSPSGLRFANLTLFPETNNGGTTGLTIEDNYEIWDGIFVPEGGGELTFCVEFTRQGIDSFARLVNPNRSNFFPVGAGPEVVNPLFSDTDLEITLRSAVMSAEVSPFGKTVTYDLTLDGEIVPGVANPSYRGTGFLTRIVGLPDGISEDLLEPNNSRQEASVISSIPFSNQSLGLLDDDFYQVTPSSGQTLIFQIEFAHAAGDLDLQLLDAAGSELALSNSVTNFERITYTSNNGAPVFLRVYGFQNAENAYSLFIGENAPLPVNVNALGSTRNGSFFLTKRPLPPVDGEVVLADQ